MKTKAKATGKSKSKKGAKAKESAAPGVNGKSGAAARATLKDQALTGLIR